MQGGKTQSEERSRYVFTLFRRWAMSSLKGDNLYDKGHRLGSPKSLEHLLGARRKSYDDIVSESMKPKRSKSGYSSLDNCV